MMRTDSKNSKIKIISSFDTHKCLVENCSKLNFEIANRESVLCAVCEKLKISPNLGYALLSMQNWYKNKWYAEQVADYDTNWFCVQTAYDFFDFTLPGLEKSSRCLQREDIKTISDIGAGSGLSTMFLKDKFKNKKVIYNSNSQKQSSIFADRRKLLKIIDNQQSINEFKQKSDCVVLFEFLEHFKDPMSVFKTITENTRCKYVLMQNSFGGFGYGHFPEYWLGNSLFEKSTYKYKFLEELKKDWKIESIEGSRVYFLTRR